MSAEDLLDSSGSVTATITRTYDGLDRLTQEATAQGTVDYTYDNASRRATMTVAGQTQVSYTYDNANRLTQIQQGSATTTFTYDDADRRTSVTLPTGTSIEYAYNNASELTTLTYKQGTTTLGTLTYMYDTAGNRIQQGGTFARGTIPPALTTVSYNANNQQTAFGSNTLTYDLNGNLASVTESGNTATYTWNVRNQLTGISATGFSASFTYDSLGRRTGKTINSATTNFLYDGLNPVQELNGSTVTANLLTGLGIDEILTRTDGTGARGFLPDALGTTIALADNTGTLQTQYTYEPFGSTSITGQANSNSFQYTGRENDDGLYYYRARYYHPRLQRFISEDPIGLAGGINKYIYVRNNPVNLRDPLGLKPCCNQDFLDCLAKCIDRFDITNDFTKIGLYFAGGPIPKSAVGQPVIGNASRFTSLPSLAGLGRGETGQVLRGFGRASSAFFIIYGDYLFLAESYCSVACLTDSCTYE